MLTEVLLAALLLLLLLLVFVNRKPQGLPPGEWAEWSIILNIPNYSVSSFVSVNLCEHGMHFFFLVI